MLLQPHSHKPSSFHGTTIHTRPSSLIALAIMHGIDFEECNTGLDKCNFDFQFESEEGLYFTVYDWKEGRSVPLDSIIEFHIGTDEPGESREAYNILVNELKNL